MHQSGALLGGATAAEPLAREIVWTHSPGSELVGGECDLDNARRYLERWVE